MDKISINFLGTGSAVPTEMRNHSAILLTLGAENILFDCGEGTQRQFKIAKISPSKLTRIFITHWHGDHILGLPGLFQTLAMSDYKRTLQIYGPKGTKKFIDIIKQLLVHDSISLEVHEVESGKVLETKEFYVESEKMEHGTSTLAYSFILKDKTRLKKDKIKKLKLPNSPLLGKLQRGEDVIWNNKKISAKSLLYTEKGKKITIILDTQMNNNAIKIANKSNLLITESSFSQLDSEKAKEYKHLTAKDAATIAKKSKSEFLVLTHISQRYENNLKVIESEAKKIFKNTKIAKDLDSIEL